MPHLRGNQWRESQRALEKKERAKARHYDTEPGPDVHGGEVPDSYDATAMVIGSTLGKISLLAHERQYDSELSPDVYRRLAKAVVPGDIVTVKENKDTLAVNGVLPRRNVLSRMRRDTTRRSYGGATEQVIAANIDVAAIVTSAQNPPLHPKFIDRYLILIQHNGIEPVVCLNKSDLASEKEQSVLSEYERLGITTATTSARDHSGIDEFKDLLRGKVAVLVGQSGVGKTSLINAIDPAASYRTGEISTASGRGRHTTTTSTLHRWDESSYIIDTPGIRALEVWDVDRQDLQYYYPEFEPFIPYCKYPDCLHFKEPIGVCAVKQVVGQPEGVSEGRYESYLKILGEL